jgi:hypothetical protein
LTVTEPPLGDLGGQPAETVVIDSPEQGNKREAVGIVSLGSCHLTGPFLFTSLYRLILHPLGSAS